MNKDTYRKVIRRQIRDKETSVCCLICGEDNKAVIEYHHIEGRGQSDEVIPLCKNCHSLITSEQNKIPPRKRIGKGFSFVTIGSLLERIGRILREYGLELIEDDKDCS